MPEGSKLGPFAYPLVPDTLARALEDACLGIGFGVIIPPCWKGRIWHGAGKPVPQLVEVLLKGLRGELALPSVDQLACWTDLEASALRALDLHAPARVPIILCADDPYFMASSHGAMQEMLGLVAAWAHKHKVAFHVGKAKTVLLCSTAVSSETPAVSPPLFFPTVGAVPSQLFHAVRHRWLGLLWDPCLDFLPALDQKIARIGSCVASLAGLIACRVVPLALALQLFESKVDGAMRFGLWLLAISEGAEQRLDLCYEGWARALLGSPPWRSGVIAAGELGWTLSGFQRAIYEVAKRRAKLQVLPETDYYRKFFMDAHHCEGETWAKKSYLLLQRRGIADWNEWSMTGGTMNGYCKYVYKTLEEAHAAAWLESAQKHCVPVSRERVLPCISFAPQTALALELPWKVLINQLSHARLKCGLASFGHLSGRRTQARLQQCFICNRLVSNTWMHIFGSCEHWTSLRDAACNALALDIRTARSWDIMFAIVGVDPRSPAYCVCLEFVNAVVIAADKYWQQEAAK